MADYDFSDFEVDEDGILRERKLQHHDHAGIVLDEDGILRDDIDLLCHYTGRSDSGIGTADKRSSSSTLNKLVRTSIEGYEDAVDIHDDEEEKSLNISELEASQSVSRDVSCDRESATSGAEWSEDNQENYNVTDPTRSDYINIIYSTDSEYPESETRQSRRDTSSYDGSRDYDYEEQEYNQPKYEEEYDQPKYGNQPQRESIAYLLDSYKKMSNGNHISTNNEGKVPQLVKHADSLFTQEDLEVLTYQQEHKPSLIEFEELEASILAEGDDKGDEMDLIGAYLKDLASQQQEEEEEVFQQEEGSDDGIEEDVDPRELYENGVPPEEVSKALEKLVDKSRFRRGSGSMVSERSERSLPERERKESRGSRGSRGSLKMSRSNAVDHPELSDSPDVTQRRGRLMQRSSNGSKNFVSTSYDGSLIENQKPPFDSMTFSEPRTMESDKLKSTGENRGSRSRSQQGTPRATKIPMLRSRSPSMSRPGSTSPSRSRHQSKSESVERGRAGVQVLVRPSPPDSQRTRSLPPTPQRAGSASTSTSGSHGRGQTSPRVEGLQRTLSESEDREMQNAANLLIDDSRGASDVSFGQRDDSQTQGLDSSRGRPPRPRSADVQKTKNSFPKELYNMPKKSSSRPATPSAFKIRNQSPNVKSARSPLKATRDMRDLKTSLSMDGSEDLSISSEKSKTDLTVKLLKEKEEHKEKEETLNQLQVEYNSLLRKYAQAENTIDEMRLGAKITLHGDSPTPTQIQTGTLPPAQHAQSFSIIKSGTASLNNTLGTPSQAQLGNTLGTPAHASSHSGSRKASISTAKPPSPVVEISVNTSPKPEAEPSTTDGQLTATISGESAKLALLLHAKDFDDKLDSFQILLDEKQLSYEDQEKALNNIKGGHDKLTQEYRHAKEEHDLMRRQGLLDEDSVDTDFDEKKEVEGELFRLGMKLDDLDHRVQDNLRQKPTNRVPFQGTPMKANHNIKVKDPGLPPAPQALRKESSGSNASLGLPSNRPPSVGSIAGHPGDIDQKLHKLQKDYDTLMDHYRRLKQMPRTMDRDAEIDGLLENLRDIYEETPEHRRPALPHELENQYNPEKGIFVEPLDEPTIPDDAPSIYSPRAPYPPKQSPRRDTRDRAQRKKGSRDSSLDNHRGRRQSDDYGSSATSTSSRRRRDRLANRPRDGGSYSSMPDSGISTPSQKSGQVPRQGPRQTRQMRPTPRRGDRDVDSGYVGSERSRKGLGSEAGQKLRGSGLQPGQRNGMRAVPTRPGQASLTTPEETSESDASTVEHRRIHRPGSSRKKDAQKGTSSSQDTAALPETVTLEATKGRTGSPAGSRGTLSDSDQGSLLSAGRSSTIKSSKLKGLEDEVEKLRSRMDAKEATATHSQQPQINGHPIAAPTPYMATPATYHQPLQGYETQAPYNPGTYETYPPEQMQYMQPSYPEEYGYAQSRRHSLPGMYGSQMDPYPNNGYGSQVGPYPNNGYDHVDGYGDPYIDDGFEKYLEAGRNRSFEHDRGFSREDRDLFERSGYHSDESPDRLTRLKEYYIPTRRRDYSPGRYSKPRPQPTYERSPPRASARSRVGYRRPHGSRPDFDRSYGNPNRTYPVDPGRSYVPQAGVAPPQPNYGVQTSSCPVCGGAGYHTHADYTYNAPPQNPSVSFQVPHNVSHAAATPVTPASYVPNNSTYLVNPNQTLPAATQQPIYVAATPVQQPVSNQTYIPVQVIPAQTSGHQGAASSRTPKQSGKVRYYVREYGNDSDEEEMPRLRRSHSLPRKSKPPIQRHYGDSVSEGESDDQDMNDSLNSALRTASRLKNMSDKMRGSLVDELSRSYQDSSSYGGYI